MENITELDKESAKPMTLRSIHNIIWDMFANIPDWAMSLLARLGVAGVFWRSGQTKITGFDMTSGFQLNDFTFMLFESEYAVPLIPFQAAAYIATYAEHFFPILLVLGLATRYSAGALLIMTLVIQTFVYPDSWPDHAVWAIAMIFIMSRGPGMLSLDHFIKSKFN